MFHYCPAPLFNTEYLVSQREASLNFSSFKAALESTQKIMGLSVVCGPVPSIFFSITGSRAGEKVKVVTQLGVRI